MFSFSFLTFLATFFSHLKFCLISEIFLPTQLCVMLIIIPFMCVIINSIGKFQMQVLSGCGHAVHEDVPEKVRCNYNFWVLGKSLNFRVPLF